MTATASVCPAMTPMSWVMSRMLIDSRDRSSSSRARIWAWIDTSSAVVGSSAMSSRGSHSRPIAIMARCRMPPDNWCG